MMIDDIFQTHFDFCDTVTGKYHLDNSKRYNEQQTEAGGFYAFASFRREIKNIVARLKRILKAIAEHSGFNTNAPDAMYTEARKSMSLLKKKLKWTKHPEQNAELLKQAHWALFNRFDYMEALKLVEKITLYPAI
tara:strand:- start:34 stop:438 length:405 start_codon:yes stop_codon:yes gene_type:complete